MGKNFESVLGRPFPITTVVVLRDIADERDRQNQLFPDQQIPDGTQSIVMSGIANIIKEMNSRLDERGHLTWRDVLAEEVAEAFSEEDVDALRKELVQVAAVAARWIEDIDRREHHDSMIRRMVGEQPTHTGFSGDHS